MSIRKRVVNLLEATEANRRGFRVMGREVIDLLARARDHEIDREMLRDLLRRNYLANRLLDERMREIDRKNVELQRVNKVKNDFLAMASHDLRGPLGVVRISASILSDSLSDNLTEDQKTLVQQIHGASDFVLQLLDDLLDVAVLESGGVKLSLKERDYGTFVRDVIEANRAIAEAKDIRLSLECPPDVGEVCFDETRLRQVLNNLIGNAVKFSHRETAIVVTVEADGPRLATHVTDQGQGIPKTELPKLFQDFHRGSVKSTGGERSTGLGLSIARRIVEAHGGEIRVESEVGRGSRFSVLLSRSAT